MISQMSILLMGKFLKRGPGFSRSESISPAYGVMLQAGRRRSFVARWLYPRRKEVWGTAFWTAELAPMVSPSGLGQLRHPDIVPLSGDVGIPSLLKLLRLKSTLATKNNRIPFIDSNTLNLIFRRANKILASSQGKSG